MKYPDNKLGRPRKGVNYKNTNIVYRDVTGEPMYLMKSKFPGKCWVCSDRIEEGKQIYCSLDSKKAKRWTCHPGEPSIIRGKY